MTTTETTIGLEGAHRAPARRTRPLWLWGMAAVAAVAAVVAILGLRGHPPAVRAGAVIAQATSSQSPTDMARAMDQAASVLVDAGKACRQPSALDSRCAAYFSAAADLIATSHDVSNCPPASAVVVASRWRGYLSRLQGFEEGTGVVPALPALPDC